MKVKKVISRQGSDFEKQMEKFSLIYWIAIVVVYIFRVYIFRNNNKSFLIWVTALALEFLILGIFRVVKYKPIDEVDKQKKFKDVFWELSAGYWTMICSFFCKFNIENKGQFDVVAIILGIGLGVYALSLLAVYIAKKKQKI